MLYSIKNTLGVGSITINNAKFATYSVWSIKDMEVLINHFEKYPLVSAKYCDYKLFKNCFKLIKKGDHLTESGLLSIVELKSLINLGLSDKLKSAFPQISSAHSDTERVLSNKSLSFKFNGIPNPN